MIAKHEGVVLHVYKDSLGIDTIGIGRNLAHRGIEVAELDYMQKTMNEIFSDGITVDDAYFLAGNDIDIVELELLRSHSIVSQLDAVRQMVLIDMAFNMGIPRLGKFSKMWNAIQIKNFETAAIEMLDSRWSKQVKSRADTLAYAMQHGEFA